MANKVIKPHVEHSPHCYKVKSSMSATPASTGRENAENKTSPHFYN
jgi:hypothetical protein